MNILFVASEGVPFIKTGGLADVIGSLPGELVRLGVNARVILPKHSNVQGDLKKDIKFKKSFTLRLGWRNQYCGIEETDYNGIHFYFLDNEYYFKREGLYGYEDDAERYAFFCKGVLESLPYLDFKPDIIHCHDWHTGLISVLLKGSYSEDTFYQGIRTVFTIHNLQYQGIFKKEILGDILSLGEEYFTMDSLEYYGQVNCMKGGLIYSDVLTTVSRTYAEEIKTPFYGEGMDGILRKRADKLYGIVNGIDYGIFNPETDPFIYMTYKDDFEKKKENKSGLQRELGLPVREDVPMIGIVSRLVAAKGLDLVVHVLDEIINMEIQLVILGTGDKIYEDLFKAKASKNPDKVSACVTFNNSLSHKIYASSDIFLMPSKFEPCGLSQIIALKYGSLPVVRETGGLKDTVRPFNEYTGEGNGFSFANYNAHEMLHAIQRAIGIYYNKDIWRNIVRNAMNSDYSWVRSAKQYVEIYEEIMGGR